MLLRALIGLLLFFALTPAARSTSDIVVGWDKVDFSSGPYRVFARIDPGEHRLDELRIWVDGVPVDIPQSEVENITHPQLEGITITLAVRARAEGERAQSPPAKAPEAKIENSTYPRLEDITVTVSRGARGAAGPPEAWISIPFLVQETGGGRYVSGGSKLIFLKGASYVGASISPPLPDAGT